MTETKNAEQIETGAKTRGEGVIPASKDQIEAMKQGKLSTNQILILKALKGTSQYGRMLTKADLRVKTGIKKGFSKILGAPLGEKGACRGLIAAGLVKTEMGEEQKHIHYYITSSGLNVLKTLPST